MRCLRGTLLCFGISFAEDYPESSISPSGDWLCCNNQELAERKYIVGQWLHLTHSFDTFLSVIITHYSILVHVYVWFNTFTEYSNSWAGCVEDQESIRLKIHLHINWKEEWLCIGHFPHLVQHFFKDGGESDDWVYAAAVHWPLLTLQVVAMHHGSCPPAFGILHLVLWDFQH